MMLRFKASKSINKFLRKASRKLLQAKMSRKPKENPNLMNQNQSKLPRAQSELLPLLKIPR